MKPPRLIVLVLSFTLGLFAPLRVTLRAADPGIIDLSLTVARDLPGVWPVGMTPYMVTQTHTFELDGFRREQVLIDEHTGTQWDAPAHFMPRPGSGAEGAGPNGSITGDLVEPWKFFGEACVIDVHQEAMSAAPGASYVIPPSVVERWEERNRPLKPGDIVIFRADYSDRFYRPFPEGDRYVRKVLANQAYAWAGPHPDTVRRLGARGVWAFACDGPSLGPVPDFAVATHLAAAQLGMIGTEGGTQFGRLPRTGALYAMVPANHAGGSGGEARAFAITHAPLAAKLISKVRQKRVADLSVVLADDLPVTWQGFAPGREAARYIGKTLNEFNPARGMYFARTHVLDTQVGTHCATSAHILPPKGFRRSQWPEPRRTWLRAFQKKYHRLPTGGQTVDEVPLNRFQGRARVLDLRSVAHSTRPEDWPASPVITRGHLQAAEAKTTPLEAGDVVLLRTGYVDTHFKPIPHANRFFAAPLAGTVEGWPALGLDALNDLIDRGIRCIGIDAPTAGGIDPKHAQFLYWLAASRGVHLVEFLQNLDSIENEAEAYFIFAPMKIRDTTGGYGRALAIY